jgi:hypothetical protein
MGSAQHLGKDALSLTHNIWVGSLCCRIQATHSVAAVSLVQQDEPQRKICILLRRIDRERPLIRRTRVSATSLRAAQISEIDPNLCATWRFRRGGL